MLSTTLMVTPVDDLVDAVKHVVRQFNPVGGQVTIQVLHGGRADDGGGDRWVSDGKGHCHLHEREPASSASAPRASAALGDCLADGGNDFVCPGGQC
jgi:hypothetical protein